MSIRFRCPKCNKTFNVKMKYAGRQTTCPCGTRLVVPSGADLTIPIAEAVAETKIVETESKMQAMCTLVVSESGQAMVQLDNTWRSFQPSQGILMAVLTVLNDRAGRCWLAGRGGVVCYHQQGRVSSYQQENNLPNAPLSRMFQASDGTIWISSYGDNIAYFKGRCWQKLTVSDGLCFNDVNGFAEDASGQIWIGTDHGVSVLHNGRFQKNRAVKQFAHLNVKSITHDKAGRIYLGYTGGLGIVHPDLTLKFITPETGLPQRTPQAVFVDRSNRIWVGTWGGGVVRVDQSSFEIIPGSKFSDAGCVGSICEDSAGNIYASSLTTGLWRVRMHESDWEHLNTPPGMEALRLVAFIPRDVAEGS